MRTASVALLASALVALPSLAGGRPDKDWRSWFGHVAGGYSFAKGDFGDIVDDDLYFSAGATYWPDAWPVGIDLDVAYEDRDVNRAAIRAINDAIVAGGGSGTITGGDVRTWGFSVDAIWGPGDKAQGFYLFGGVGFDDIKGRITEDGLVYYPPVCDPWWWWCYPGGVGPGTIVADEESTTEFSWNAGVGWAFGLTSGSVVYVEARYKSAETDRVSTESVPLVVGFRW